MIITSLLDTDWYKFTMSEAIFATIDRLGINMPHVLYKFKCRNKIDLLPLKRKIQDEIKKFQNLTFKDDELRFIGNYLKSGVLYHALNYVELRDVSVNVFDRDGELQIQIEGPWFPAILYEVPILAIVNELYFKDKGSEAVGQKNLFQFIKDVPDFTDFGTRRRYSKGWHEYCFKEALKAEKCRSTSNVLLSKKYNITPSGTQAHEWFMAFQALSRQTRDFQQDALNHWMLSFRGDYGVALTDTIGIDTFLKDWDGFFARNYYGLRHDSGGPLQFIEKVRKRYNDLELPCPMMLFSDGLNAKKCNDILYYSTKTMVRNIKFGIGTHFTNNCGVEPLQIVIKLAKVNGQPVVKLSDSPGKVMCEDEGFIKRIKTQFNLKG